MILLFDPAPPQLQWRLVCDGTDAVRTVGMDGDWPAAIVKHLPRDGRLEAIGYVLYNGGDEITETVGLLTPETVRRLEDTVHLLPEHNEITLEVAKFFMRRNPEVAHVLFCDTAFFTRLPPSVRDYALPREVTERGVHRYGGYGLCHELMWRQAHALTGGSARKVISIYLGDRSNLAAIQDGTPVETTIGLTHLEGVLSSQGCGDIDPTIIFQLGAAGFSYSEINRMLSTESGFTALAGRPCHLADIAGDSTDPGLAAARRMLVYQVVKYVGAMLASLGGADALAFVGADISEIMPLVRDLCDSLAFLGVRCERDVGRGTSSAYVTGPSGIGLSGAGFWEVSAVDSAIKVFVSGYDPWEMMSEQVRGMISKGKEQA